MLLVGIAATAAAEPPPEPTDPPASVSETEQARKARDRAFELLQQDRYPEAIEQLESAHAAVPNPGFLLNIAIAHRRVGACAQALDALKRFREACSEDCSLAQEGRAKGDQIEQACRSRVRVQSQPPGLAVRVDGVPRGRTPLDFVRKPGPLEVTTSSSTLRLHLRGGEDAWIQTLIETPPPPPPRPGPAFRRGLGWGLVGLGGAGLVLGSTFAVLAATSAGDRDQAIDAGAPPGQIEALDTRADRETAVALVGLSLAAVSAVTTVVLWTLDPANSEPAQR